jgi:hypothetical protein
MGVKGHGRAPSTRKVKQPPALSGEDLGKLRVVLESQRSLGSSSYPLTVSRLFELAGVRINAAALATLAAPKNAKLFALTAKATKKDPHATSSARVFVPEDAGSIAASAPIFAEALSAAQTTGSDLFTSGELAKRVAKPLQKAFQASVDGWARTGRAPFPGVIVLRRKVGKKTALFLHRLEPAVPVTVTAPVAVSRDGFARDFAREFDRLDRATGSNNYVLLHDLRRALPEIDRTEFDNRLKELRLAKLFTLDSSDGQRVRLTPEQLDAGIREGSSNLVYVARR